MTAPTRLRLLAAGLSLAALGGLAGCSSGGSAAKEPLASVAPAAAAPTNGAAIDPATFAAAIKRPGTVVIDVRTPAEFASGHLAGALNIDVNAADFVTKVSALATNVPYAVYCHTGNRSATAVAAMGRLGFTEVYGLAGGIAAWTAAGGATTS